MRRKTCTQPRLGVCFSQALTWISCTSVHPVWTRSTDRNRSDSSSREMNACRVSVPLPAKRPHRRAQWQQRVLCLLAILMGIHTSIRNERAYRGVLTLTRTQVPHQQRGKACLLRQRIADSSHWPQSPQMRR